MIAFRLSIVLAAIVIAWAIVRPAGADVPLPRDKPGCSDLSTAIENARERAPALRTVRMNAFQSGAFLDAFNRYPPASEYDGDAILVTSGDIPGHVTVYIFNVGCIVGYTPVSLEIFAKLLMDAERAML